MKIFNILLTALAFSIYCAPMQAMSTVPAEDTDSKESKQEAEAAEKRHETAEEKNAAYNAEFNKLSKHFMKNVAKHNDPRFMKKYATAVLFEAIKKNQYIFVNVALAFGANVNAKDNKGNTPAHYAAALNVQESIIQALIDRAADFSAQNNDNKTPAELCTNIETSYLFQISK